MSLEMSIFLNNISYMQCTQILDGWNHCAILLPVDGWNNCAILLPVDGWNHSAILFPVVIYVLGVLLCAHFTTHLA
jgi:hypothetical protein